MNNKHDISEEEILSSAKNIMDNFMRSLEQATEVKEEFGQQRGVVVYVGPCVDFHSFLARANCIRAKVAQKPDRRGERQVYCAAC